MKRKISASLLAFMLVFQVMSSSMLMPFTALATGANPAQTNDATDATEIIEPSEAELAANKIALEEATKAVNALFTDETKTTIKDGLIDAMINTAEVQVNLVAEGEEKSVLQQAITEARTQVAATAEKAEEVVAQPVVKKETTEKVAPKAKSVKSLKTSATTPKEIPIKIIDGVVATLNGNNISNTAQNVQIGDKIAVRINFELEAEEITANNINNGDYFTYKLPLDMLGNITPMTGKFPSTGEEIGEYLIENGYLKVTFTNIIDGNDSAMPVENGFVELNATLKAVGEDTKQDLVFGESTSSQGILNVPITFTPKVTGKKSLTKTGVLQNDGTIKYTVTVNEDLKAPTGAKIKDILPNALEYSSIKVTPITIKLDGTQVNEATTSIAIPNDKKTLEYKLPDLTKAYKLEYVTINNSESNEASEIFNNTVILSDDVNVINNTTFPLVVNYGYPIAKRFVEKDNTTATWEIKYNYNQKQLVGDKAIITDTFSDYHELDEGTIAITSTKPNSKTFVKGTDYDVVLLTATEAGSGKNGFKIVFKGDVLKGTAVDIRYKTKMVDKDGIVSNKNGEKIINNVLGGNGKTTSAETTFGYNLGSKNAVIDYVNKTIKWTINLAPNGQQLKKVQLTDRYPSDRTLIEPSDIKIDGVLATGTQLTKNVNGEFILELGDITKSTTITYSTKYNEDLVGIAAITNVADFNYTTANKTATQNSSVEKSVQLDSKQIEKNGYKSGKYNYEKRQFEWELGINYKGQEGKDTVVTDTLSTNQTLNQSSIKLYEVTLGDDNVTGALAEVADPATIGLLETNEAGYKFTFNGPSNNKTYLFKYTTIDKDGKTENSYTNDAKYTNGKEYIYDAKVENIGNFNTYIEKGKPNVDTVNQILTWTIDVNKAQSSLKNAVITDTPGSNQLILPNSFKIIKLKTSDGINYSQDGGVLYNSTTDGFDTEAGGFKIEKTVDSEFKITFPTEITSAYRIVYDAYYNDLNNTSTTNVAVLSYGGTDYKAGLDSSGNATVHSIMYADSNAGATRTKTDFKFKKVDAMTLKPLAGAEFVLYNGKGTVELARAITDVNGEVIFKGFYEGTYQLQEKVAPIGYDVSKSQYASKKQIKLFKDKSDPLNIPTEVVKTVGNYENGKCYETTITVNKDGKPVKDAIIVVKDSNNKIVTLEEQSDSKAAVTSKKTDSAGLVTLPAQYTSGNYSVEIVVDGISKTITDFSKIIQSCAATIEFNDISCVKTELIVKNNGSVVENATIQIKDNQTNTVQEINPTSTTDKMTLVTDKDGKVDIPTKFADDKNYSLFITVNGITKTITNYTIVDCSFTVEMSQECVEKTISIKNQPNQSFKVTLTKNGVSKTFTSTNGSVVLSSDERAYWSGASAVVKIKGYTPITITTVAFVNCELVVDPVPNKCPIIELQVVDSVDKTTAVDLRGATVIVEATNGYKTSLTADTNGKVYLPTDFEEGKYKVTISKLGYVTNTMEFEVKDCIATPITIVEFEKCPDFTINYNGPAASQAEFKLVKVVTDAVTGAKTETDVTTDIKVVTDATTNKQTLEMKDSTGKVITALEAGDYKLVQTKTHPGYQATSSTFTVIEGVCQAEITVSNSPTPPPVCDRDTVITITDLDGTPVVPNEKTVVTVDGKPVNFTVENDKVVIPKTEIPNTADSSVVITLEDGRTTTTTLSKDRVDCTVDVQVPVLKVCDKNPTITIKTKDGKEVPATLVEKVTVNGTQTPVVTENGKVVIPKTSVNPKEDTVVTITLKDGTTGTVTVPKFSENCEYEVEITPYACEKATVTVKVNGEAEAGITVKVVNDKGQTVQTAITDKKGVATIQPKFADENHKVWVTIFEETKSYAFKDCAVKINVKPTPNVEGDTEENTPPNVEGNTTPPTPGVKGDKEDNKNDVKVPTFSPPGKTYNVYDENGDLVERNVKVGKDGKIDIKNLPAGKYTLVAVDGDKKISFEVGKNGLLPQTGAQDVMLYSLMGIVLLAAGVLLIGRNRRKNA